MSAPNHPDAAEHGAVGRARPHLPRCVALLLCLLAALLLGLPPALVATPARADENTAPLSVAITSITPASPQGDGSLTITGTVRNVSSSPVHDLQVVLWCSTDEVGERASLDEVLAASPEYPLGRRLVQPSAGNTWAVTDVDGQPSQAFGAGRKSFAAGQSASFRVTGKLAGAGSMQLEGGSTYLVGVQARGAVGSDDVRTLGRARALSVVTPSPLPARPLARVATAVLLNSRPSLVTGNLFIDNHLADELHGRLADLLALAVEPGATVLVDPLLVDELQVMARGYTVQNGTDTAATRAGQAAAARALQQITTLAAQPGRAYRTLYGSPDVELAVRGGRTQLLTRAARALPSGHPLAGLGLAVVPAQGVLSAPTMPVLAGLHPALVLATTLGEDASVQDAEATRLVAVDPDLFAGGPGPEPTGTLAQVVGRLQAEQRLAPVIPVSLVSTTLEARAELAPAAWRTRIPLGTLLATTTPTEAKLPAPGAGGDPQPRMLAVDAAGEDISAWGELVAKPAEASELNDRVLPAALSTAWGPDGIQPAAWLARIRQATGQVSSGRQVDLHVVSSFVTSAPSQEIPVTVSNGLDLPIHVKVLFDSENPQRVDVADSAVHTIAPGDSETIKVRVTSRANGAVGVLSRLATAQGRPIGATRSLTVTATQAGRVGWLIIIASGVVLLAGTAIRIRQVQHERRVGQRTGHTADLTPGQRRGH